MPRRRGRATARRGVARVGAAVVGALSLGGCVVAEQRAVPTHEVLTGRGGTLTVLRTTPFGALDPVRLRPGPESTFATDTYLRTLTTFLPTPSGAGPGELVGDAATNGGTTLDGGRTWRFTIRAEARWQDNTPVTCADAKYGLSRAFAPYADSAGAAVVRRALGVGQAFTGPDSADRADFDTVVSCDGAELSIMLERPVPDLDAVMSLPASAPYSEKIDQAAEARWLVFSNGPYMLEGSWKDATGGRFVRTRFYAIDTELTVRYAKPEVIEVHQRLTSAQLADRLISQTDGTDTVTLDGLSPAPGGGLDRVAADPSLAERVITTDSSRFDVLEVLDVQGVGESGALSVEKLAWDLMRALDRSTYAEAFPGPRSMVPRPFDAGTRSAARYAGLPPSGTRSDPRPVRIGYVEPQAGLRLEAVRPALAESGFDVTLVPVGRDDTVAELSLTAVVRTETSVLPGVEPGRERFGHSILGEHVDTRLRGSNVRGYRVAWTGEPSVHSLQLRDDEPVVTPRIEQR